MSEESVVINKPKVRLKFIDMARSIAILLMLEGHFVDDSLLLEARDPSNAIYATWVFIRGFTAPMFLTVTGLIFVYLLLKNGDQGYFSNLRVRKGFKRVIELFFWGYLLQYYAFHVLECIAVGIFTILLIYGIYKLVRFIPLWIYFLVAGFSTFGFYLFFRELPEGEPWPAGIWHFAQNAFHGPRNHAIFPIVPSMGFTMFGAMIGALVYRYHKKVTKFYFPFAFIVIGASLFFFPREILGWSDSLATTLFPSFNYQFVRLDWLYEKVGMIFMILGLLISIDKVIGHKIKETNLFLKVGQNTLTIYIVHMMVLYGSVIGIGVNDFCHKSLGPWQVFIGAVLFILSFVLLIKYLDWIKLKLDFILSPIKDFFNKIFFVS
ncbi:MAG: putative membrane protein [Flavobacteriaceae bacterium]|jgi:uncharacterized membrane protein